MRTEFAISIAAACTLIALAGCGGGAESGRDQVPPTESGTTTPGAAGTGAAGAGAGAGAGAPGAAAPARIPPPPPDPAEIAAAPPARPDPARLSEAEALVEASPDDVQARRRLGVELVRAGKHDQAIAEFQRAIELDRSPRTLLDLALAYAAAARLDEAEATYQQLLGIAPGDPIALHNLGNLALRQGNAEEAVARYEAALENKPDYLLARYHLGDALRQAGRYRDAYRTYEQVLEMEPQSPSDVKAFDDSLYRLASLDLQMGAPQRAVRLLAELLHTDPEHAKAYYAMGQALMQLGQTEQAQRAFDTHMRLLEQQEPTAGMAAND